MQFKSFLSFQKLAVGLLAALCIGSARADVVFDGSGEDFIVKGAIGATADVLPFSITTAGKYLVSLLSVIPTSTFDDLSVTIANYPALGTVYGTASLPSPSSFTFEAAAGRYAALVSAFPTGKSAFYQITVTEVTPVPEPGTWLLMLGGIGLLGVMRLRKSEAIG